MPETVRTEAADIAASAAEQAGQVTGIIGDQAKVVVSEAGDQARQLLRQGVSELRGQAREAQWKVAGGLRNLADQLHSMSELSESGMAPGVVRQVSERAHGAASWLECREPGDLVEELRNLARRRPGTFLAGAAFAGMLVGRLTRNLMTGAKNDEPDHGQRRRGSGPDGQTGEPPTQAYGIATPGRLSATDLGYTSTSGHAPPEDPAEPQSVTAGSSGHPGTGPGRS